MVNLNSAVEMEPRRTQRGQPQPNPELQNGTTRRSAPEARADRHSPPLARIFHRAWVESRFSRDPCCRATGPAEDRRQLFCKKAAFESRMSSLVAVGESPTATGGSPVPPIGFGAGYEISGLEQFHEKSTRTEADRTASSPPPSPRLRRAGRPTPPEEEREEFRFGYIIF